MTRFNAAGIELAFPTQTHVLETAADEPLHAALSGNGQPSADEADDNAKG